MATYRVKQGKHDYRPNKFWIKKGQHKFRYHVVMDENNVYDLVDEDQHDWNKGGGISNYLWSNFKMSCMWGFRFNKESNLFEHAGYFHRNGDVLYPGRGFDPTKIVSTDLGEHFIVDVVMKKSQMSVIFYDIQENVRETYEVDKPKHRKYSREIGSWFGGNETAPRDLSFEMDIQRTKL